MAALVMVPGRVETGTRVAAADVAARHAPPQADPCLLAGAGALLADRVLRGRPVGAYFLDVLARGGHGRRIRRARAARPPGVAGPSGGRAGGAAGRRGPTGGAA